MLAIRPECRHDGSNLPLRKRLEPPLLRTINPQLTLWESILPQCCLGLPGDLAEIDELLDDERFFEPSGRSSTR